LRFGERGATSASLREGPVNSRSDAVQLLAGTSGYSFKEWCGHFYPEKLPATAMLSYYAERLATVEINNTFYRMPAESMLARWATEVPAHFAFALKAPRRITHEKRLVEAGPDATQFLRRAATLEGKLGALLFQLPPFLKKDLPRLTDFLAPLPAGQRIAFEFRHDSWQSDNVYDALRAHGALLCVTDTDEGDTPFVATSDQGYLRLRRTHYSDADLRAWLNRIAAQPLSQVYVYFMHEDEALGTRFAQRLMKLWHKKHN
jgi:uncharacterized protein YecE (DUF72 family)